MSIFIPKLRLILILNSFLGSSDSLVFSELFHSLAPRPLAARSISDFLLTYLAKIGRAVQQECRDRYRMPSSARKKKIGSSLIRGLANDRFQEDYDDDPEGCQYFHDIDAGFD